MFDSITPLLPEFPDNSVNILDFGAKSDGETLNTEAINKAIEACSKLGGGRVVIPAGFWLTGPIVLQDNINLHIESGALVLFTSDFKAYPLRRVELRNGVSNVILTAPIYAENVSNIAITGAGIFDGSGHYWRPVKKFKMTERQWRELLLSGGVLNEDGGIWWPTETALKGEKRISKLQNNPDASLEDYEEIRDYLRPRLLNFINCQRILLDGPVFQNSPMWNIHPLLCEEVTIRNITVRNPWFSQNGDGLDIESCKNVLIENSTFDVGDDAICMKSGLNEAGRTIGVPTENVHVRNNTVYHGHGGFTIGSEMSGGVKNVLVEDCKFIGTDLGLRFKSVRGRGGVVEDIYIRNIHMVEIKGDAITIDIYYEVKPGSEDDRVLPVSEETPVIKDIFMDNITCRGAGNGIFLRGLPEMPLSNIQLKNVDITAKNGIVCENTENYLFEQVIVKDKDGNLLFQGK